MGTGNSDSSAGSSRRGKKSSSEKPKQPQRGLGVAQLEKIRLQSEMAEYLPPLQPPFLTNLNMEDQVRIPMVLSSSVPSSSVITTSSSLFAVHPNVMTAYGGDERTDFRYSGFGLTPVIRPISDPNATIPSHYYAPQNVTLPLFEQTTEVRSTKDV
ncbi:hypothetical protein ACMD2_18096 [Ananas comosus]|uniref:Uncharacterized protein n=1 Tax=Ananas comosus TaxID=4615 RepID=A0A199UW14_ANACO|nr:hypothetical protein ACMD2_18096 [Ananas comosus]